MESVTVADDVGMLRDEIQRLRADLVGLRTDSQVRQIEHATLTAKLERAVADNQRIERSLEGLSDDLWKKLGETQASINYAKQSIEEKLDDLTDSFVSIDRFRPVEVSMYGLITIICSTVILGLLGWFIYSARGGHL
jgi:hypothetical protein